jgi:hypothetical protein
MLAGGPTAAGAAFGADPLDQATNPGASARSALTGSLAAVSSSHYAPFPQAGDRRRVIAKLRQDLVGVLPS